MQKALATINLILAFIATTAPLAHLLELPSKLSLDGRAWLHIQQVLYRGWGPVFGPIEMAALFASLWLAFVTGRERAPYVIAALCYGLMLVCFFAFNDPVNQAVNGWTPAALPADWSSYRAKWELGHALAALLSVAAWIALLRARIRHAGNQQGFETEMT